MRKSNSKFKIFFILISWLMVTTWLECADSFFINDEQQPDQHNCLNDEFENYGCECGQGYYQPFSDSFVCKNGIYSLDCDLNQTRIESINKLDYLIGIVEETSSASEVCWSSFAFENALKLSSHTFSYLQFRPVYSGGNDPSAAETIRLKLRNVFEIDSYAFSSIKLRWSDSLRISLENSGMGIFSSIILKPRCFGGIKRCMLFQIRNFYQLSKLYLKTSYFDGSEIETLWVENVNDFGGFETDMVNQTGFVRNLVITKCYLKTLRMHTIGSFEMLESVQVTWSGLAEIEPDSFGECCRSLKSLNLANNLLVTLSELAFHSLGSLEYLNLENNPLESLEPGLFDPVRGSLVRLNLKSTRIERLNDTLVNMASLTDLILADTSKLKRVEDTLNVVFANAPQLEYLDLSSSRLLSHSFTLNPIVDKLAELLDRPDDESSSSATVPLRNLKFIDLSSSSSVYLNDTQFRVSFARRGQCLWRSLLDRVFVRLDANHPCDCTLFYFYRNLANYHFPITNFTWAEKIRYIQVDSNEFNTNIWSNIVTSFMPKCYASFWLQTFSFDLIKKFESQCGFISDDEFDLKYNCSASSETTTNAAVSTPTTRTAARTSFVTGGGSSTKTTQKDLFLRYEIMSNYSLPIVLGVVGIALLGIALIIIKTRYDYKNKFLKIYEKTLSTSSTKEPKELDLIL